MVAGRRPVAALEVALADALQRRAAAILTGPRPIPFGRFMDRPTSEPVLVDFWSRFENDQLALALADAIVAGLTGEPARRRSGPIASSPDRHGRRTVYAPPDIAAGWIDRVNATEATGADPFILACHAYAEVALSHPYADGNGRLARAMFQRAFARASLLDAPLIPLGPLIYLNHKMVIDVLVRLGTTGDWPPFLDVMARLTHKALAFTEHQLKSSAPPPPRDIDGP